MLVVGHHLQLEAARRTTPRERDVFGRSAYNRYYYGVFLCVREMLLTFNPDWVRTPHGSYPDLLEGQVRKSISQGRTRAQKAGDRELEKQCYTALSAARNLSTLFRSSIAIRIIADYSPDIAVSFQHGNNFYLNGVSVEDAYRWQQKAEAFVSTITSAWRQFNAQ
jgi:uncharacterized protein (UPF0332 family)